MTALFAIGASTALVALFAAGCVTDGENDSILVLAAASMTDALVEIGDAYEAESGVNVTFSFGGSNALARQVEFGAPADAVIFAGSGPMDQLEASGDVVAGSRDDLLSNRLVVIGGMGASALSELAGLDELDGRIALADPALAPAGFYAKQSLESVGLYERFESRLIPTLDVRAAVGAVDTGGASFGLVYATDASANSGVEVLLVVSEDLHDRIVYPAAVVEGSGRGDAAAEFLDFLGEDRSLVIFETYGFEVPGG